MLKYNNIELFVMLFFLGVRLNRLNFIRQYHSKSYKMSLIIQKVIK
jgi:hypothetical protein